MPQVFPFLGNLCTFSQLLCCRADASVAGSSRFNYLPTTMGLVCLYCRLYDAAAFNSKYATQAPPAEPKAQRRAPSAPLDRPAAQPEAAAAAAPAPEAPAAAVGKPPRESAHAHKATKEGHVRTSTAARNIKESSTRDALRDARDTAAPKEVKDVTTKEGGRDRGGREAASKGGKEHGDRAQGGREGGRDSGRAAGKAAEDQQLADVRAAALKATVNGTNGDASKGRSPARRDELANGTKAATANGAVAVPGTKRRAPDSGAPETR